jgi:beta-N-acetylhexosaminidase
LTLIGVAVAVAVLAVVVALSSGSADRPAHRRPAQRGVLVAAGGLPQADRRALIESRARTRPLSLRKAVGQLLVGTYSGVQPPATILADVHAGRLGGVILMGGNTAAGVAATRAATRSLQEAARAGGNPGLLVMTDQEGGEVKRLEGPPAYAAAGMTDPGVAREQGAATAELLRQAGVNVDLAPVADVSRTDGFMTREQRTFGSDGASVARAVCAFARGLAASGVAYTLKHFPGLGDAEQNTDAVPVGVPEPTNEITADDAPYRRCGHGPLALVMVSSASYDQLTGSTPAVLSPYIYRTVLKRDGVDAVTISDSFESGAISAQPSPALTAINAGLDMVLYPDYETTSRDAYDLLVEDARQGTLHADRVLAAAGKVLTLKAQLGLG